MRTVTISLIQLDVRDGDPEANLARGEALVREAARRGSDIVVLPELWTVGYGFGEVARLASRLGEGAFARVAAWAREHRLWITGSFVEAWQGGFANSAPLFNPEGEIVGIYRKIHLFRLMDEHRLFRPGDAAPVFDLPFGRAAIAICYDLRFPELFRRYGKQGVDLVLLPAEWPHPRLRHWRVLLQARAIENQYVVAACNRVGTSGETRFFGHSAVVSPWGERLVEAGEQEVVLTTDVDLEEVARVRAHIPVWDDRRPEIYG